MSGDAQTMALAALFGYLIGATPFGLLLTRTAGLADIRGIGSGNIGATNVLRTGHKGLALATLLLDIAKGAGAVLAAGMFSAEAALVAGAAAFLGHLYPVWLKFKGGKGVATFLGVMAGLSPLLGLAAAGTWLVATALFRISALAGLLMAIMTPLWAYYLAGVQGAWLALALALLVFWRHRENISRLLAGTEPRIGQSKK